MAESRHPKSKAAGRKPATATPPKPTVIAAEKLEVEIKTPAPAVAAKAAGTARPVVPAETAKAVAAAPEPAPEPAPAPAPAPAATPAPAVVEIAAFEETVEKASEVAESVVLEVESLADRMLDTGLRGLADHLDFLSALATATSPFDALQVLEGYRATALDRMIEESAVLADASMRLAAQKLAA